MVLIRAKFSPGPRCSGSSKELGRVLSPWGKLMLQWRVFHWGRGVTVRPWTSWGTGTPWMTLPGARDIEQGFTLGLGNKHP